jgi:hypothetical protein
MLLDGTILNEDINASAAIVDTKLATIATAGKVSNSATTAASANTASAIVARDASGNFTAGTITAALTGAASSNVLKAGDTMTGALVVPLGAVGTPSLTFTGDLNTGIYSPGADQVAVATNGTGRLFIDASGNIGVGITPNPWGPTYFNVIQLGSRGGAIAHATTAWTSGSLLILTNNTYVNSSADRKYADSNTKPAAELKLENDTLIFSNAVAGAAGAAQTFTEKFQINSAGLVGIGVTPSNVLHVQGAQPYASSANSLATSVTKAAARVQGSNDASTSIFFGVETSNANPYLQVCNATGTSADPLLLQPFAGRVGIGTTGPAGELDVRGPNSGNLYVGRTNISGPASEPGSLNLSGPNASGSARIWGRIGSIIDTATEGSEVANLAFQVQKAGNLSEVARLDGSGRLLVGTSTNNGSFDSRLQVAGAGSGSTVLFSNYENTGNGPALYFTKSRSGTIGSNSIVSSGDKIGRLEFLGADGSTYYTAAAISAEIDGTPGAADMPGRLVFSTTADGGSSPTERMRINANGNILFGCTGLPSASVEGFVITGNSSGNFSSSGATSSAYNHLLFYNSNGIVGAISTSASATAFATSSDYRLKENVEPITDGIARLQQLKPSRFNFIADPDKTFDGFIAHETQAIVPECVTGEKDAVGDDGNPIYQGIDQSKLVPLLTAALQEAIGEIESLKARLTAAGL